MLDEFLEEVNRLKLASHLLSMVWEEMDVYNSTISPELNQELQKFFDFDDSE